ncbi:MAG: SRPBCC family protein [Sporichthyaceae bacterium]
MHISRTVDAPAEAAWHLLADTGNWSAWGPSIADVTPNDALVYPGMKGKIRPPLGVWLPFEITAVTPGRSWEWKVAGLAATGHRVDALDTLRCRISFEIPWWAPGYAPVCKLALRRIAELLEGHN